MRKRSERNPPDPKRGEAAARNCGRLTALGLPADADCRLPALTVTGGRYVRVEHHCGILSVGSESVRLYSRLGIIRIEGKDMIASEMDEDVMLIDGRIRAVTFEQFCQMQGNIK